LPLPVADSHAHLDLMGVPIPETLLEAMGAGVEPIMTVGIDVPSSQWAASTAAREPGIYAAVAVHPNNSGVELPDDDYEEIARLAALPQVRAVGETGLDHYRTRPDGHAAQEMAFRRHIAIAKDTGKALVIHDRDAHDDVLRVLAEEGAPDVTVFHCFSGDAQMAQVCAHAGYFMSFAGNLTFRNAEGLRAAAGAVPAELLLVETDAPFLTPMPYRGRPNAPYLVPFTVRALASLRNVDLAELCSVLAGNWTKAFGPG
jgi:TatD DNase family protein